MAELKITRENFEREVLQSDKPVLIDFWASWCGPCRMLSPTISEIAEDYKGKVKVGKVNVDEEEELANKEKRFKSTEKYISSLNRCLGSDLISQFENQRSSQKGFLPYHMPFFLFHHQLKLQ